MLKQLFYSGPSIEVLHEEYAKKGRIDEEAPVKASHEVRIEAPVEQVWELLSDVPGWGTWYPDVHDVHLDSGVKADARFTWTNGKARIKSTGDGATRVPSEESMAGPLFYNSAKLQTGLKKWLSALKPAAEER